MAVTIGSNIASLVAQRALAQNSNGLSRTFERLSSGLRIDRASDDAAGLAIADRLRADSRLFSTAARNINDGFSLINISNGALEQQTGILHRLVELAEQSANGTYSDTQRRALDVEYRQLLKEFGRIGDTTTFNGLNLLQGNRTSGIGDMHIQAGINGSVGSRVNVTSGDTASLSGVINRDTLATPDWNGINGVDVSDIFVFQNFGVFGSPTDAALQSAYRDQLYIVETTADTGETYEVAMGLMNGNWFGPTTEGVSVHVFYRVKGTNTWTPTGADNQTAFLGGTFLVDPASGRIQGDTVLTRILGTTNFSIDFSGLRFLEQGSSAGNGSAIDFTGVDSITRARSALGVINSRLSEISQIRGQYGAFESRLLSALNIVTTGRETALQARSRIVDADIGAESAELYRRSILQQASAAVLAQANTQPQLALTLLNP